MSTETQPRLADIKADIYELTGDFYPLLGLLVDLEKAIRSEYTAETLADARADALDHHAGWCSCAAMGWLNDGDDAS